MPIAALPDYLVSRLLRNRARVRHFVLSARSQRGSISLLTLTIILVAPGIALAALVFIFIVAYVSRVSRVTAELEAKKKPTVCPACGHKLVEIRKFCAECGASIWPSATDTPGEPDIGTTESGQSS